MNIDRRPAAPVRPRVLLLASQPYFEWRGSPIRIGFDAQALAANGYEVDFLVLPVGRDRALEGVRLLRAPRLPGVRGVPIGPSMTKFLFDGLLFWQALGLALRRRYAVIHGVEDAGFVGLCVARLSGAKAVFEKHSDPDSYAKPGFLAVLMRQYARVERFVMRRSDAVIGTGPGLVRQVEARGGGTPAFHIPDFPSSLVDAAPADVEAARARLCEGLGRTSSELLLATYVGSFAAYQGIDLLFDSMVPALRSEPRLAFVVVGGTESEIAARRAVLEREGLAGRVLFLGKIAPDDLPPYLRASDLLLSPRIAGVNTPLKLLDYFKAGRAIVATDQEANRLIVDETTACLTPLTPDGFAAGVVRLAGDAALRERLAVQGLERIRTTYNFEAFRRRLQECYHVVLGAPVGDATDDPPESS